PAGPVCDWGGPRLYLAGRVPPGRLCDPGGDPGDNASRGVAAAVDRTRRSTWLAGLDCQAEPGPGLPLLEFPPEPPDPGAAAGASRRRSRPAGAARRTASAYLADGGQRRPRAVGGGTCRFYAGVGSWWPRAALFSPLPGTA